MAVIMDRLMQWVNSTNLASFKPLRMVLNGPAGTGKTVVINTIVTLIRQIFNENDAVQVCAPTGVAAFNAGGETLHHAFKITPGMDYDPHSSSENDKKELATRMRNLLCMIIDERSLLDSKLLGTAEQKMRETAFDGNLSHLSWGNVPIIVLVGDDYQLPGVDEGPLDVLFSKKSGKMLENGRSVLKECASFVMSLKSSKRIQAKKEHDKILMNKLRVAEELNDSEVARMLNLHLDEIELKHGEKEVQKIKKDAIYLFFKNAKKNEKNLEMLVKECSKENPVAICRTNSSGIRNGFAVKKHFLGSSDIPDAAMLCIGCKVAMSNKNWCPRWGLHNGAVGTVQDIVFANNKSPNQGDLPLYVVVEFPNYKGPTWDTNNPNVSQQNARNV